MNQPVTKTELARLGMDALDPQKAGQVQVSRMAGGVSFVDAAQVMDFAKLMSVADKAIPSHLRANPGACLRIVFQAVEWQMSPWAVADKSYLVNDRIAYESQLVHAVVEARAPLQHRLDCTYEGEGVERRCTVIGHFLSGDTREYQSPKIKDIKVKNSPLWTADPDQQLFYYSSRSWARKWCPDVLMGIYSREELADAPGLGREDEATGLHSRLAKAAKSTEGHKAGHVESELDQVAAGGGAAAQPAGDDGGNADAPQADKRTTDSPKGKAAAKSKAKAPEPQEAKAAPAEPAKPADPAKLPKTVAEWDVYCRAWIDAETNADQIAARWAAERGLRNKLGVTADDRMPVEALKIHRVTELEKK